MLNQCQFIGNLGADPEVKSFQSGGRVCNIRLAVTEKWKDRNTGERKERTTWVPVSIFADGLVSVAERYLRKGSKVFIQGAFSVRKWQDQSGNDRYSTEIVLQGFGAQLVLLDAREGGDRQSRQDDREPHGQVGGGGYDDLDDDVPF